MAMVRDEIFINTLRLRSKEGKDRISTIMLEELFNMMYRHHSVCG